MIITMWLALSVCKHLDRNSTFPHLAQVIALFLLTTTNYHALIVCVVVCIISLAHCVCVQTRYLQDYADYFSRIAQWCILLSCPSRKHAERKVSSTWVKVSSEHVTKRKLRKCVTFVYRSHYHYGVPRTLSLMSLL